MHRTETRTHDVDKDREDDADKETEEGKTTLSGVPSSELLEYDRVSLKFEVQYTVDNSGIQREGNDDRLSSKELPRSDQGDFEDLLNIDDSLGVCSESVDLAGRLLQSKSSVT